MDDEKTGAGMVGHTHSPNIWLTRQEDHKLEASLGYMSDLKNQK